MPYSPNPTPAPSGPMPEIVFGPANSPTADRERAAACVETIQWIARSLGVEDMRGKRYVALRPAEIEKVLREAFEAKARDGVSLAPKARPASPAPRAEPTPRRVAGVADTAPRSSGPLSLAAPSTSSSAPTRAAGEASEREWNPELGLWLRQRDLPTPPREAVSERDRSRARARTSGPVPPAKSTHPAQTTPGSPGPGSARRVAGWLRNVLGSRRHRTAAGVAR